MSAADPITRTHPGSSRPRCLFCRSEDSMTPFRRSQRVFLLSRFLPVRWRYCRRCARHFLDFRAPRNAAD